MENLENISMMIIAYAGSAKSFALEAYDEAIEGNFDKAKELMKKASENLKLSNKEHFQTLSVSANGNLKLNVLFIHAEDQMMAAETIITLVEKMINLIKIIK